jgi:hypothetical protein
MKPDSNMSFPVPIRPGNVCVCNIELYRLNDYDVVVCTELPENEGMSVTNAAEKVATAVVDGFDLEPERLIWIEHYPVMGEFDETWDSCEFKWEGKKAVSVGWYPIAVPDFSALEVTSDLFPISPRGRLVMKSMVNEILA